MMWRNGLRQTGFSPSDVSRGWRWPRWGSLFVLAVAAALLVALGCGGGGGGAAAPAPQQPAAPAQPAPAAPAAAPQEPQPPAAPRPLAPPPAAPAPQVAPKYGGTLNLPYTQEIVNAGDNILGNWTSIYMNQVLQPVHGSGALVRPCPEDIYKVCAGLAESWEANRDFTQWTFKVRDGVLWHDGTQLTAEHLKFWLDLALTGATVGDKKRLPAQFKPFLGSLQKIEVLEGNRLRLTYGRPEPQILQFMNRPELAVRHPQHLMQPRIAQGALNINPEDVGWVGTGPFRMHERLKGTRIELRRFDKYWEKDKEGRRLPFLDGIVFFFLSDATSIDAAVRTGRLDAGFRGPEFTLNKARRAAYTREMGDKVYFVTYPDFNLYISFNLLKPGSPLQDVRVRKALSLWIDKQAAIEAVFDGFSAIPGLLAPSNPYTSPDLLKWPGVDPQTRERDRAEAKRLLAEAGYAKGFSLEDGSWRVMQPRWEFAKAQYAQLGIDLKLNILDTPAFFEARSRLGFDHYSASLGWKADFQVPELVEPEITTYSRNKVAVTKHEDPKILEFFDRLRATSSFEKRVEIHRELERYMFRDQVYLIPFLQLFVHIPIRSYVKGLPIPQGNSNNHITHATVWLDK